MIIATPSQELRLLSLKVFPGARPCACINPFDPHQGPHAPPVLQVRKRLAGGNAAQVWWGLHSVAGGSLSLAHSHLRLPVGTSLQGLGPLHVGGRPHILHSFRESLTLLSWLLRPFMGGPGGQRWPFYPSFLLSYSLPFRFGFLHSPLLILAPS